MRLRRPKAWPLFCLLLVVAVPFFPASGDEPGTPPASEERALGEAQAAVPRPVSSPSASGGSTYVLQRGDKIQVRVFNMPDLDQTAVVRPDGRISIVLMDDVQAAGLSTSEFDAVVTTHYQQRFVDPEVSVIVQSFANLNVYVGGEVLEPGLIRLHSGMTAAGAVFLAGGFRTTAQPTSVMLLRDVGGALPEVVKLDLEAVLSHGEPDAVLRPFDVVFVPKSGIAKANQFVDQYIRKLIPISMNANFTYITGRNISTD